MHRKRKQSEILTRKLQFYISIAMDFCQLWLRLLMSLYGMSNQLYSPQCKYYMNNIIFSFAVRWFVRFQTYIRRKQSKISLILSTFYLYFQSKINKMDFPFSNFGWILKIENLKNINNPNASERLNFLGSRSIECSYLFMYQGSKATFITKFWSPPFLKC